MDKKKLIKLAKNALKYLIYAAVIYYVYYKLTSSSQRVEEETGQSIIELVKQVNPIYLFASVFIFSFHSIWNGLTWTKMMRWSGEKVKAIEQMDVYLVSYVLRYIPGNVVGILARGIRNQKYNVPLVKSLWGWFFENIVYLFVAVILGLYSLTGLLEFGVISSEMSSYLSAVLIFIAVLFGLVVILKNDWLQLVFDKFLVPRLPEKSKSEFKALDISLKHRATLVLMYFVAWVIYSVSFIFLLLAFDISGWDLLIGVSINAIAWAIGYMSLITPSGTGVRESVMIFLLSTSLGLDAGTSVLIALVARVIFIVGELLGFAGFWVYRFIYNIRNK